MLKIDITKIEGAIEKGRGYYEFIASVEDNKEVVFRFNRTAFRNNYTMSDLPKMQLTYYAIHVGKMNKKDLEVQKEFEFGTDNNKRIDYSSVGISEKSNEKEIDVYDIVLAGILEK